jgi:type I restriction enzyme R subunit
VIIDEAHRSVYQKYGAIIAYFDSLLSGLTATLHEEIDRNTYELFDREIGLPNHEYRLDQAVSDGFLVPFRPITVPLRFPREGINYDDLSDEEKAQWDLLDWEEGVLGSGRVDSGAINAWLFNANTVDKGLEVLMTQGCHEASGDRLGKSVIFARNHKDAEFIRERFDHHYPHLAGKAARVIDNQVKYAQSLIDEFADPGSNLRIAISVDMLDTGIDIPEIVNLVIFKPVRSRTKFWQMVGRGTRTCKDLFGPGRDKECFWIFDLCQNLEFFLGQGGGESTAAQETLSRRPSGRSNHSGPQPPPASAARWSGVAAIAERGVVGVTCWTCPPRTGLLEGIALKLAFSSRCRNAEIVLSSERLIPVRLPCLSQQFQ